MWQVILGRALSGSGQAGMWVLAAVVITGELHDTMKALPSSDTTVPCPLVLTQMAFCLRYGSSQRSRPLAELSKCGRNHGSKSRGAVRRVACGCNRLEMVRLPPDSDFISGWCEHTYSTRDPGLSSHRSLSLQLQWCFALLYSRDFGHDRKETTQTSQHPRASSLRWRGLTLSESSLWA
jgi:hypothetical protein